MNLNKFIFSVIIQIYIYIWIFIFENLKNENN